MIRASGSARWFRNALGYDRRLSREHQPMKDETRASRGATAGLENAFLAVRTETYAPAPATLQARYLSRRYGLSPGVAAATAALAFALPESWRAAR